MIRAFVLALSLLAVVGCGSSEPKLPPQPPHGGTAFALPGGSGFVEVLRHDPPGQEGRTQLVVYFLDGECKPLSAAATAVSFKPKARAAQPVVLKSTGDSDPTMAGALATDPFRDPGEIAGVLAATIANKPIAVSISLR